MSRPILPSAGRGGSSAGPSFPAGHGSSDPGGYPNQSKITYAKRGKITIVACALCRKRKTKCDGGRPACAQCQARVSECHYEMTDEQRRLTKLRDNMLHLSRERASLESLLNKLHLASQDNANELLRRIRESKTDIYVLAAEVHSEGFKDRSDARLHPASRLKQLEQLFRLLVELPGDTVPDVLDRLRSGDEVDIILSTVNDGSSSSAQGQIHDADTDSASFLMEGYSPISSSAETPAGAYDEYQAGSSTTPSANILQWTNVTNDSELIEHLVLLYFSWHHPFIPLFSEAKFRRDLTWGKSGSSNYCSKSLLNAICAVGCLFSARDQIRHPQEDGSIMVTKFFDEAMRALNKRPSQDLTTIAAISILSFYQGNLYQMSSMWMLNRRSTGMVVDANLHVRHTNSKANGRQPSPEGDDTNQLLTFWGSFITDQMLSLALARLPIIPRNSISVDLPTAYLSDDDGWRPYGIDAHGAPGLHSSTLHSLVSLSKIVNSTLNTFYAPNYPMSGKRLLDQFLKYQKWFDSLPERVRSGKGDLPSHVLAMLMYYWNAVLLLFRPFVKATITDSNVSPAKICHDASTHISELFAEHQRLYGLAGVSFCQLHCLVTACTIHIMRFPLPTPYAHLENACDALLELAPRIPFAEHGLDVISSLIQKWGVIVSKKLENALQRSQSPMIDSQHQEAASASSSALLSPKRPLSIMAALEPQKRPRLQPLQQNIPPGNSEPSPTEGIASYLFVPFSDEPLPLLVPIHTDDMEDVKGDEDIINRLEGLTFSRDWRYDR